MDNAYLLLLIAAMIAALFGFGAIVADAFTGQTTKRRKQ